MAEGKKKESENLLNEGEKPIEELTAAELKEKIGSRKETTPKEPEAKTTEGQPKEKENDEEKEKQEKVAKEVAEQKKVEEKLIAGKFKTHEELIKTYQEAEKKISQQGDESSKLRKQSE